MGTNGPKPHEIAIDEVWGKLISELQIPDEAKRRIGHLEEAVGEKKAENIQSEFSDTSKSDFHEERVDLRGRLSELLVEALHLRSDELMSEAAESRKVAASLRREAERISPEDETDGHAIAGQNLAWIRESFGLTQVEFASEELQGCIARSTYAKLESGRATSIKVSTLKDIAVALGINFRLLLFDEDTLKSLIQLISASIGRSTEADLGPVFRDIKIKLRSGISDELRHLVETKGADSLSLLAPVLSKLVPPDLSSSISFRIGVRLGWMRAEYSEEMSNFVNLVSQSGVADGEDPISPSTTTCKITGALLVGRWARQL